MLFLFAWFVLRRSWSVHHSGPGWNSIPVFFQVMNCGLSDWLTSVVSSQMCAPLLDGLAWHLCLRDKLQADRRGHLLILPFYKFPFSLSRHTRGSLSAHGCRFSDVFYKPSLLHCALFADGCKYQLLALFGSSGSTGEHMCCFISDHLLITEIDGTIVLKTRQKTLGTLLAACSVE